MWANISCCGKLPTTNWLCRPTKSRKRTLSHGHLMLNGSVCRLIYLWFSVFIILFYHLIILFLFFRFIFLWCCFCHSLMLRMTALRTRWMQRTLLCTEIKTNSVTCRTEPSKMSVACMISSHYCNFCSNLSRLNWCRLRWSTIGL